MQRLIRLGIELPDHSAGAMKVESLAADAALLHQDMRSSSLAIEASLERLPGCIFRLHHGEHVRDACPVLHRLRPADRG